MLASTAFILSYVQKNTSFSLRSVFASSQERLHSAKTYQKDDSLNAAADANNDEGTAKVVLHSQHDQWDENDDDLDDTVYHEYYDNFEEDEWYALDDQEFYDDNDGAWDEEDGSDYDNGEEHNYLYNYEEYLDSDGEDIYDPYYELGESLVEHGELQFDQETSQNVDITYSTYENSASSVGSVDVNADSEDNVSGMEVERGGYSSFADGGENDQKRRAKVDGDQHEQPDRVKRKTKRPVFYGLERYAEAEPRLTLADIQLDFEPLVLVI